MIPDFKIRTSHLTVPEDTPLSDEMLVVAGALRFHAFSLAEEGRESLREGDRHGAQLAGALRFHAFSLAEEGRESLREGDRHGAQLAGAMLAMITSVVGTIAANQEVPNQRAFIDMCGVPDDIGENMLAQVRQQMTNLKDDQ